MVDWSRVLTLNIGLWLSTHLISGTAAYSDTDHAHEGDRLSDVIEIREHDQ